MRPITYVTDKFSQWHGFILSAFVVAFVFSAVFVAGTDRDHSSMIWQGDFPGFYGPVWQVFGDRASQDLYNIEAQRIAQNLFFPGLHNNFYIFAYPPFTTIIYAPFLFFDPVVAKILCSLIMLLCSFAAFSMIQKNHTKNTAVALSSVAFLPLFIANMSAQNTGMTIMLLAICFWFLNKNSSKMGTLAGIFCALLAYKPQFGLFMLGFLVIENNWRALSGMGIGLIALYLFGAVISGVGWPSDWLNIIRQFSSLNYENNMPQLCSLPAVTYSLGVQMGIDRAIIGALSFAVFVVALLLVNLMLYQYKKNGASWQALFFFLISSIPLISPQTLFYDLGVGLFGLSGLILTNPKDTKIDNFGILVICCLGLLCESLRHLASVPVYSALSLLIFVLAGRKIRRMMISS